MKNATTQKTSACICFGGVLIPFKLRPATYGRLIEITAALNEQVVEDGGKAVKRDITEVILDPSPLDIATMAFCLMDDEGHKKLETFTVQLNGKDTKEKVNGIQKLYYLMTETNDLKEGAENFMHLTNSVNTAMIRSFPSGERKKKVLQKILAVGPSLLRHLMLRKCTT